MKAPLPPRIFLFPPPGLDSLREASTSDPPFLERASALSLAKNPATWTLEQESSSEKSPKVVENRR